MSEAEWKLQILFYVGVGQNFVIMKMTFLFKWLSY